MSADANSMKRVRSGIKRVTNGPVHWPIGWILNTDCRSRVLNGGVKAARIGTEGSPDAVSYDGGVIRLAVIVFAACMSQACLVLTVNPSHDRDSLVWDPALVGDWHNADDNSSLRIERAEWQSYRIEYVHPIETGQLTGYLTRIGKTTYLDVMPARGQDRGSFLIPVHATLRVVLEGDRLELTALSYDWFVDRLKKANSIPGLTVALDEKENALIVNQTNEFRSWLAKQPPEARAFGASAVFTKKPGA